MATDWTVYNLPAIWDMVRTENACVGADRVLAWDGLADSVREQHRRLVTAADELAAVWSPSQNASAQAFFQLVDGLSESMKETLKCAEDTRSGLHGVMVALSEAQGTLQTLAAGRQAVGDDWMPRFIDHAEDEYDVAAQQTIRNAEAAIADHSTNIKSPPLFEMRLTEHGGTKTFSNESGGISDGGAGTGIVRAMPVAVTLPNDSTGGFISRADAAGAALPGVGLGLSGVTVPPATPIAPASALGLPIGPAVYNSGGGLPYLPIGGGSPSVFPGAGLGVAPDIAGAVGNPAASRQTVSMRRPLPSGAVIGEGSLGPRGGGGQGVVGQASMGATPNRNRRGMDGPGRSAEGTADEQWEVQAGVAPVIRPDSTPLRADPGPGVLGIDR